MSGCEASDLASACFLHAFLNIFSLFFLYLLFFTDIQIQLQRT